MPLSVAALSDALERAFDEGSRITDQEPGSPPNIQKRVADLIAGAYDEYVKKGSPIAGGLMPVRKIRLG